MCKQALIFLCQKLLTKCLFNECPILIDGFILLSHLRISRTLCVIFSQELLQCICIEAAGLLVNERRLEQHRVSTSLQHILQFSICDTETKLLSLVLYNLCLHKGVPYHVLYLVELLVIQGLSTLLHLDHFSVLINKFLEFIHINLLSQNLSYLLTRIVTSRLTRAKGLFSNECKKTQSNDTHQKGAFASNFS